MRSGKQESFEKQRIVHSDKEELTKIKTVRSQTHFIHCIYIYIYTYLKKKI